MNQFAYCGGNPMMGTDPLGMMVLFSGDSPNQGFSSNCDPTMGAITDFQNSADLWQNSLPGVSGSVTIAGTTSGNSFINTVAQSLQSQTGFATSFSNYTISGQLYTATWCSSGQFQEGATFGKNGWQSGLSLGQVEGNGWLFSSRPAVNAQTDPNQAWNNSVNLAGQVAGAASAIGGGLSLAGKLPRLAGPLGGPVTAAIGTTADILNPNTSAAATGLNAFFNVTSFTGPMGYALSVQWTLFNFYPGGPGQAAVDGAPGGSLNSGVHGVQFGRSYR